MNTKILISLFFIAISVLFSTCKYDNEEDLYPFLNDTTPCDTVNITYTGQIKTFLDTKCATSGCHAAGQQSPDLSVYGAAQAMASNLFDAATNNNHNSRFTWTYCERKQFYIWCNNPVE